MSRIAELRSQILKAKQAYSYGADPLFSDRHYDALEDELRLLSPDDPVLKLVGAPVPPDSMLTKASHRIPMGSQSKVNSVEEFKTWHEKSGFAVLHASIKGDGASAAAYYDSGRLKQCISRGDGNVGEDVTANALKFKGLPAYVEDGGKPFTGAVLKISRLSGTHTENTHGIFLASGPDIDPDAQVAGINVHDIAPTLLYGLGLPVAENFAGKPWQNLFTERFRRSHPLRTIRSWGMRRGTKARTSTADGELVDELRGLGYINN